MNGKESTFIIRMTTISVLIPTIGRTTLQRAIDSIVPQLAVGDQLIVIGDGPQPAAKQMVDAIGHASVIYDEYGPTHDWGGSQLDYATEHLATGDFLAFCGDDDAFTHDALELIRAGADGKPWPHIFCMYHTGNKLGHSIASCAVSGQQLVVPNDLALLPKWSANGGEANDVEFIRRCVEAWGKPEYHDDIICIMQQQNRGAML